MNEQLADSIRALVPEIQALANYFNTRDLNLPDGIKTMSTFLGSAIMTIAKPDDRIEMVTAAISLVAIFAGCDIENINIKLRPLE